MYQSQTVIGRTLAAKDAPVAVRLLRDLAGS